MKTGKKVAAICCSALCALPTLGMIACGERHHETLKDEYTVKYNLNYDGADTRSVSYQAGLYAVDWNATREGYDFNGWYLDSKCTKAYNFFNRIKTDVTLYASWEKQADKFIVTFDGNSYGKEKNTIVAVAKGGKVRESSSPTHDKIGFDFEGWYKDADCTQAFDFDTETVNGDLHLYAKYVFDDSVEREKDGTPVYENVRINLWLAGDVVSNRVAYFQDIIEKFNKEYAGKIEVNGTTDLFAQNSFSLRFYESSSKSGIPASYYPVADVYDLAGIEYDPNAWYNGASAETYLEDRMFNIPIVTGVPHLIYNKALMQQYSDGNLPSNYSEFAALMKRAYDGEHADNADFLSAVMCNSWGNQIITSHASFLQNDAEYYRYENGEYVNKWSEETTADNALTAFNNLYSVFGEKSSLGGKQLMNVGSDGQIVSKVGSGNALFGVLSFPGQAPNIVRNGNIGIMPLSGFFSDGQNKDLIPTYTMGMGFYKAQNLSNTELAACAVFADYVSEHSYLMARGGWYPVYKTALDEEGFTDSDYQSLKFMADYFEQIGDPENFVSMYGHPNRRGIAEDTAKNSVVPFLQGDGTDAKSVLDALANSLPGRLAY